MSSTVDRSEILPLTPEIERATAERYARVAHVIPAVEWTLAAPYIVEIDRLKCERNAVILAHHYQSPAIYHGIADYVGDSLGLALEAAKTDADVIVMCGVHFMAETAKLVNPEKIVLSPDLEAGCSLAESITGRDVRLLRERYPNTPVVSYVNTSAEVKAESDICCTSANAVRVVESLGVSRVLFLPDKYLADYVASQTKVEIIAWHGACEVHERFTPDQIREFREENPGSVVLAHPECPPDVLAEADYVGSTSGMITWIGKQRPSRVILVTECSMSANIAGAHPNVEFLRPCILCPHMQRITLPKVRTALERLAPEVVVPAEIAVRARRSVERMLDLEKVPT
ncbi:MAG TPA: quinolinate synthase NadA [Candidatus Baltobacteraceae bacterium]|jgi:quinolinate synthase|nr:quinolinate synthase NadA [Candidatus Baltobacteraceae bacterium]